MSNETKNGNVKMPIFILIITLFVGLLGVIWRSVTSVQDDTVEIRIDAKETRTMLNALIGRINGGEITIKNNLK